MRFFPVYGQHEFINLRLSYGFLNKLLYRQLIQNRFLHIDIKQGDLVENRAGSGNLEKHSTNPGKHSTKPLTFQPLQDKIIEQNNFIMRL